MYLQRQFRVNCDVHVSGERHGASRRCFSRKNARNNNVCLGQFAQTRIGGLTRNSICCTSASRRVSSFALQKRRFFRGADDDNPQTSAIRLTPDRVPWLPYAQTCFLASAFRSSHFPGGTALPSRYCRRSWRDCSANMRRTSRRSPLMRAIFISS